MDIKVKFISSKNLSDVDSRRIQIDEDLFNPAYLVFYFKNLFNLDESEVIYIKWKDKSRWLITENDWNAFTVLCLEQHDSVIKLDVYYGNVHRGIECDVCGNTVVGDRYKCLQCDDFDICQLCFQSNCDVHREHCLILLRTPEDSAKFLRSIPITVGTGSDFRVLDIDLAHLDIIGNRIIPSTETSTQTVVIDTTDKMTDCDSSELVDVASKPKESPVAPVANEFLDASVTKEYYDSLPAAIHESLEILKSMGFKNINSTMIELLLVNNGNIYNVLEQLEYSAKH